jgi:hypothetical protein
MASNNANGVAKSGRRILPKLVSFWSVPISKLLDGQSELTLDLTLSLSAE